MDIKISYCRKNNRLIQIYIFNTETILYDKMYHGYMISTSKDMGNYMKDIRIICQHKKKKT